MWQGQLKNAGKERGENGIVKLKRQRRAVRTSSGLVILDVTGPQQSRWE